MDEMTQIQSEPLAPISSTIDLIDITQLTTLFGEPDSAQGAVAAWTGDTCYSTSGEPVPMWSPAEAAELHALWIDGYGRTDGA